MILDTILERTRADLIARKTDRPEETLIDQLKGLPDTLDLHGSLKAPGVSIIAEIKRASPSKGPLNSALDPRELAAVYAGAGADAISVLTEPHYFRGSLDDLAAAREGLRVVGLPRPILRKDFIIDPYQLLEARVAGADAVLLIAAALDDGLLSELHGAALALGLTPLVEVHDEAELARALELEPRVIGINNRNLKDFTVDIGVTRRLRPLIPARCAVVSESGIGQPAQMRELAAMQVDAALIGETLVTATDPAGQLLKLKEAGRWP